MKNEGQGATRSWRLSVFLNVVVMCALGAGVAFGIVAVVRQISFSKDLRFDLTRDARYALDETTKSVLRSLESPIQVTFIHGVDDDIARRALDPYNRPRRDVIQQHYLPIVATIVGRVSSVLNEWQKTSPEISVRIVDQTQTPRVVEEISREMGKELPTLMNRVILTSGRRRREVPIRRLVDVSWGYFPPVPTRAPDPPYIRGRWRVQPELTSALRALSSGEDVPLGIVVGKRARFGPASELFTPTRDVLKSEGYQPVELALDRVSEVPKELAAVLLLGIQGRLTETERALLQRYESGGGRLFVLADPYQPERYGELLEPYGYVLDDAVIHDVKSAGPRRQPSDIDSRELCVGRHPIDRPLLRKVNIYLGQCRPLVQSEERAPGAVRTTLLRATDQSLRVPVDIDPATGKAQEIRGAQKRLGRAPSLAVAFHRPALRGGGESRMVVFGGSGLLLPYELGLGTHYGNRDLFLNCLGWLTERPAVIGITPTETVPNRVASPAEFESSLLWVGVIGLPLLALGLAFATYFTRRS